MRKSVIPSRMKYGVYRSPHIFYLTGVQGRFLASLEMTISGKAVLSFSALETLFPPLSFIPLVPYPARFARHLPHAGKALFVGIGFLRVSCIRFGYIGLWLAALAFCANKNRSARTGFAERFWFYYSTVTDFARFLGLSTSFPLLIEV